MSNEQLIALAEKCGASGMTEGAVCFTVEQFQSFAAALAPKADTPEEMSPEFTDTARAALLWVLWHHQGASSTVGQPIRFALGMGQFDRLNDHQLREAKRWGALAEAPSHSAPSEPTMPVSVRYDSPPEVILRAMVRNYREGHQWDGLDALACSRAADAIETLRATVAKPVAWTNPDGLRKLARGFGAIMSPTREMHPEGEIPLYAAPIAPEVKADSTEAPKDDPSDAEIDAAWHQFCGVHGPVNSYTSARRFVRIILAAHGGKQ